MQTFQVMSLAGHDTLVFSELEKLDAETKFRELVGKGYAPVAKDSVTGDRITRTYDPAIDSYVFRAPLAGG